MAIDKSIFDAESFLDATVEGVLATSRPPMPEIEDAQLMIKSLDMAFGDEWVAVDLEIVVDEAAAREATGFDEPTVRHRLFLDTTDDGMLDMSEGKNIALGRLRVACGWDPDSAEPWNFRMLEGAGCRGHIVQDPDDTDPSKIYNRVKSFAINED